MAISLADQNRRREPILDFCSGGETTQRIVAESRLELTIGEILRHDKCYSDYSSADLSASRRSLVERGCTTERYYPRERPALPPNNDTVEMHSLKKSEIEANTKLDLALGHR
jgi:hypothetical protein